MPETDTTQQFFLDYGEFAYAEGFLGKDANNDSIEAVLRYGRHIAEHSLQHYEIFTNSFLKENLTYHNLLYYHVYGDYRMVIDNEGRASYRYIAPDFASSDVFEQPVLRKSETEYFLEDYMDNSRFDVINGIYNDVTDSGQPLYGFDNVPWLTQELSREGTGSKFNIPSIGTQIVKLHSFGNASQSIKEAMINEMLEMVAFYERNYNRMPDYIKIDDSAEVIRLAGLRPAAGARPADELNENISDLFVIMLSQMRNNPEYIELTAGRKPDLNGDSVDTAIREIYTLRQDYDNDEAVSKFINTIFGSATQKFVEGESVTLTFGENSSILQLIADQLDEDPESGNGDPLQYQYDTFVIDTFNPDIPGYVISHVGRVQEINITDPNNNPERYFFKDNDLRAVAELNFEASGDVQYTGGDIGNNNKKKKKKGKGKKTLEPSMVVYQRIILDTFAAMQALIHLSDWAGFGSMERSVDLAKAESKMRFLSKGVNVYSVTSQSEKQGDKKKSKLKAVDIYHTFPKMTHFAATRLHGVSPKPKKDKKSSPSFGLLDEMTKWRTYYTLSTLATIRKKTFDTQLLDNFYSKNMLIPEIKWLTSALAEGTKVLVKKKSEQDLLSQAQYRDLGNTGNITQFAPAPLETVFYEVDVPLLKMVIAEYNDVHNKTIIARAFNVPTKIESSQDSKDNVYKVLKRAKDLHTRAKRALERGNRGTHDSLQYQKGEEVGRAILLQPSAFIVDEPDPRQSDGRPSDFIGVTYKPTGDKFEFHVSPENIPRDLQRADEIRDDLQDRLADPISTMPEVQARRDNNDEPTPTRKPTKVPDEGQLAKLIWTSARDRIRGIFDIEGVKPHEFMDSLFREIDKDLSRSNLMRSPFPEAWLGTDTVSRLTTDPMYLGMAPDRKYYSERLVEYVDALKSRYINNWRIPTTLVTMFENAIIKYTKDPEVLKQAFLERLEKDADRANLVTTDYILRPYQMTIAIMRNVLTVPLGDREMYAAEEIDQQMRRDIQDHLAGGEIKPILPTSHPLYSQFEPIRPVVTEPEAAAEPEPVEAPVEAPVETPTVEVRLEDGRTIDVNLGDQSISIDEEALASGVASGVVSGIEEMISRGTRRPVPPYPYIDVEDTNFVARDYQRQLEGSAQRLLPGNDRRLLEGPMEEIPAPPEMRADQLDANWDGTDAVIPEPDDIEEFEEVYDNPEGVYDNNWMYYDEEHRSGDDQLRIKMDDGEIVQYKFHIALDPSDYLKRTRDIVSTFLNKNKIHYKCGGTRNASSYSSPTSGQYGKMFTLYVENHREAITVVKGMQVLSQRYNLKGLVFQPTDASNMSYERVVPGTNNTLYYTVEMASSGAVIRASLKAGLVEVIDGKYKEMRGSGERRRWFRGMIKYLEKEKGHRKLVYLGPKNYYFRPAVMDYYWGQGPIDAYLERGNSP